MNNNKLISLLDPIRTYCVYCRGELTKDREINQQYHFSCKDAFTNEISDFEHFDPKIVDGFSNKVQNWQKQANWDSLLFLILMFSSIYLLEIDLMLSLASFSILIAILFWKAIKWRKIDNTIYFCDIIKEINPQLVHLSKNDCLALNGEVYIVNSPKKFNLFNGLYIIKFLSSKTVHSNKNAYPEAPMNKAFKNKVNSISFVETIKKCQIRYNSNRAQRGLARMYYIRYKDAMADVSSLNQIIASLNSEPVIIKEDY